MQEKELAEKNLILKVVTGSRLYGTNNQDSDEDYQGIFIPSSEYVYGLKRCDHVEFKEASQGHTAKKTDYVCYNLIKYIKLAIDNNPNILSVLYTPDNQILFSNVFGKLLIEHRHLFLSKKSYHTYRGYAHAQKAKLLSKQPLEDSKRAQLVAKHGYDVKFAMHLIRLLYEVEEIFTHHRIQYPSTRAKELIEIRSGKWDLNRVLALAVNIEERVDYLYKSSDLQHTANYRAVEKLQMEMLEAFWGFVKEKDVEEET